MIDVREGHTQPPRAWTQVANCKAHVPVAEGGVPKPDGIQELEDDKFLLEYRIQNTEYSKFLLKLKAQQERVCAIGGGAIGMAGAAFGGRSSPPRRFAESQARICQWPSHPSAKGISGGGPNPA